MRSDEVIKKDDTVVGISVAKFTGSSAEGLGLFIPIKDALESLGVSIKN